MNHMTEEMAYNICYETNWEVKSSVIALINKDELAYEDREKLNAAMETAKKTPKEQTLIREYVYLKRITKKKVTTVLHK